MSKPGEGTFLSYRGGRWLWISLISSVALCLHYLDYQSRMLAWGGSTIGLIYGLIGTIIILVLMYLGIRKRSYASRMGTLKGWVSAHVALGLLTLLIIPLHAGFRFGFDVHTLAYVLLAIVVLSGIFGVVLYQAIPVRLTKYETELQSDKVDKEIARLLSEMRAQIKDKSDTLVSLYQQEISVMGAVNPKGWSLLFGGKGGDLLAQRTAQLATWIPKVPVEDQPTFQSVSQILLKKTQLEIHLLNQMQLRNAMQAWLYLHVPVSIAMLMTVAIHLWSVFYY